MNNFDSDSILEQRLGFSTRLLSQILKVPLAATSALALLVFSSTLSCLTDSVHAKQPPLTPIKVELKNIDGQWKLLREGANYLIKGAGGEGSLELLAEAGGNSNRIWGANDDTAARLDEAHRNGISVAFGVWLEHERHGFDYADVAKVDQQFEQVLAIVKQYKDHPAVLVWGLGNEMEGAGDNPLIWQHIEKLATAVKEIDPQHPTMTVIAEMGGQKIQNLHHHCPSIDIVGINSYGGATTVPERYRQSGGTKPYIVTEFGPPGAWETGKNQIDAVLEKTSTEKEAVYRDAYRKFGEDKELCLGSYAFLWGHKQEATATWFGLLLADGKKTGGVDVMAELWSGSPVANRCPQIQSLSLAGEPEVKPGTSIKLELKTSDPENDQLNVRWELLAEANSYNTGGDFQESPPSFAANIQSSDQQSATIKMPDALGLYRAYAYVDDGAGGAAVANVPVRVSDGSAEPGTKIELPFTLYDEPGQSAIFIPSGWMGSADAIAVNEKYDQNPKSGTFCLECKYAKAGDWGGVVWQSPAEDWGDKPGGLNLSGAKKMTFWARGAEGGEEIKFGFGLLGREKKYFDTGKDEMTVALTTEWKKYTFDVSTADLTRIKSGFYWSVAGQGKPLAFYLDAIKFQ